MDLPLDQLSVAEKLRMMETLWDQLTRIDSQVPSPAWHGELLGDRETRIDRGEAVFSDWDEAKRRIRKVCHGCVSRASLEPVRSVASPQR